MIEPRPIALQGHGVRLEPMTPHHREALAAAASDGRLWELWFTSVPAPDETEAYIATAIAGQRDGHMLPWIVREKATGAVIGSTRYHDIVSAIDRVEIGYTWYAARNQRSYVNTACKLVLLGHAFDALGCQVVGLRTDGFNFRSQRAIEALGAKAEVAGGETPSGAASGPSPGRGIARPSNQPRTNPVWTLGVQP